MVHFENSVSSTNIDKSINQYSNFSHSQPSFHLCAPYMKLKPSIDSEAGTLFK